MLKKLVLAPLFLISFAFTCFRLSPFLDSYDILFSLNAGSIVQIIVVCALLLISSFLFTLFITFSQDLKLTAPVVIVAAISSIIFLPKAISWILALGFIAVFLLVFFNLNSKLKTYLTFQPAALLTPSIKTLSTLLILVLSVGFYLSVSSQIKQAGFSIPNSLIDMIIKSIPPPSIPGLEQIDQKQISLLQASVKDTVKSQIDQTIEPYISFIPIFLSISFFLTLSGVSSILSLFLSPLLWIIFKILTESGFATFTTEMREVKKLVV